MGRVSVSCDSDSGLVVLFKSSQLSRRLNEMVSFLSVILNRCVGTANTHKSHTLYLVVITFSKRKIRVEVLIKSDKSRIRSVFGRSVGPVSVKV